MAVISVDPDARDWGWKHSTRSCMDEEGRQSMSDDTHALQPSQDAYHLRLGRWGKVVHISARLPSVLLQFADGTIRAYPVEALRVRNACDGEPTVRCRVEGMNAKR